MLRECVRVFMGFINAFHHLRGAFRHRPSACHLLRRIVAYACRHRYACAVSGTSAAVVGVVAVVASLAAWAVGLVPAGEAGYSGVGSPGYSAGLAAVVPEPVAAVGHWIAADLPACFVSPAVVVQAHFAVAPERFVSPACFAAQEPVAVCQVVPTAFSLVAPAYPGYPDPLPGPIWCPGPFCARRPGWRQASQSISAPSASFYDTGRNSADAAHRMDCSRSGGSSYNNTDGHNTTGDSDRNQRASRVSTSPGSSPSTRARSSIHSLVRRGKSPKARPTHSRIHWFVIAEPPGCWYCSRPPWHVAAVLR